MKSGYSPCLKCTKPTENKWQLCFSCRRARCPECAKVFTPKNPGVHRCGNCLKDRRKLIERMGVVA
jgi:hypothetical protein